MTLRWIRRVSLACTLSLAVGLAVMFGGIALASIFESERLFTAAFIGGWAIVIAGIPLWMVAEFVRCPKCGRPFNRQEYRRSLLRMLAKTSPRWSCLHCGYGSGE